MLAAIVADMVDGRVNPVHQPGGDNHVQKFAPEIIVLRGGDTGNGAQAGISPHLDPGVQQGPDQPIAMALIIGAVDQQAFRRPANPRAPCLGIQHHRQRLARVGIGIDINVADPFEMGEHRHARLGLHQADKPLAAPRHDHIDERGHAQHFSHGGAVPGRHHLDGGFRQARGAQPVHHAGMQRARGMITFRAAAQDHRISGFQAQRGCVGRHVRAAFINHANHAQRSAHTLDMQPAGPVPFADDGAHGIVLRGNRAQTVHDVRNPPFIQRQPVHHRRGQPLVAAKFQIAGIGRQDIRAPRPDGIGGGGQRGGLGLWRGEGQHCRGVAGRFSDPSHHLCDIHVVHETLLPKLPCRRGGSAPRAPDSPASAQSCPNGAP